MKNFTKQNFKTNPLWIRLLIMTFMVLLSTSSAWAWGGAYRDVTNQPNESPTFYLGDKIAFYWILDNTGSSATYKKVYISTSSSNNASDWKYDLTWIKKDNDEKQYWKSSELTANATGTRYYSLWLGWGNSVGDNGHYYNGSSTTKTEGNGSFIKSSFSIKALPQPTNFSGTLSGTTATLNWTHNATYTNVLIVRYIKGTNPTSPVNGTNYNVSGKVGDGTVVYKGDANTCTNTITAGNSYDYYVYTINNNYYSSGVKWTLEGCTPTTLSWANTFTGSMKVTDVVSNPASLSDAAAANSISYTSSNPDVISVNGTTLTALKSGKATITASATPNTGFCSIKSIEKVVTVTCDVVNTEDIRIEVVYTGSTPPNIWAWEPKNSDKNLTGGTWPGQAMTPEGNNVYSWEAKPTSGQSVSIIISGEGKQTVDIDGLQIGKRYKFKYDPTNGEYDNGKLKKDLLEEDCLAPACTPSATITEATYSCYGNTIHLEGSLTEACGGMYYGWQYKTTSGDDWSAATAIAGHASNNYSTSAKTYELDWTIPSQGTTYYFRAYATLDANTWYSDGTSKTVTTYARATQYKVTGNENTLTLSGSQTGYTYTLYDTNGAVAESSKTGTGNALTWNLSGVSTFSVKARPTGSTCDEVEMDGNYTNRIDPISDVTLDYCNEEGDDIDDPNPMCKGAIAYVKLSYVGSKYSDIKWLVEGVETNLVTDEGDGVWSYEIQGDGSLSVELKNDANTDPTWPYSNKLPFRIIPEPTAPYISINPASGVICYGDNATITVTNPIKECSYKLVSEGTKAGFTAYVGGDLTYIVNSVDKYYVVARHDACSNEYTSNQVAITQVISTSAKISIEPENQETTPWEPVNITITADEGYIYEVTYTSNNLANVDGVIIKQNGDTYTYRIPRPATWGTGNAPTRTPVIYGIKAQLKVDGEANQCNLSSDTATIKVIDEENEKCD